MKKALPPLKKSSSLLQSSLDKSSFDSPNRKLMTSSPTTRSNDTPSSTASSSISPAKGSSPTSSMMNPDATASSAAKGLSLRLGGKSFLKPEMKEAMASDDESASVPIKIVGNQDASKENVKSILKTSPTRNSGGGTASGSSAMNLGAGNLRAAMIARDEKRIQFNIKEDSKNIIITTDEEESSSAAIDDIKPKRDFLGKIEWSVLANA